MVTTSVNTTTQASTMFNLERKYTLKLGDSQERFYITKPVFCNVHLNALNFEPWKQKTKKNFFIELKIRSDMMGLRLFFFFNMLGGYILHN